MLHTATNRSCRRGSTDYLCTKRWTTQAQPRSTDVSAASALVLLPWQLLASSTLLASATTAQWEMACSMLVEKHMGCSADAIYVVECDSRNQLDGNGIGAVFWNLELGNERASRCSVLKNPTTCYLDLGFPSEP